MASSTSQLNSSLVVIGAGLSGITALVVARKFIPSPETIVIADQRGGFGGHWIDAYDFVRLHQPYEFYTAYDEGWRRKFPVDHLASKSEVLEHLEDVGNRMEPTTLFHHRYIGHSANEEGIIVQFEHVESKKIVYVKTKYLIKATPVKHFVKLPFEISSKSESISSISITELSAYLSSINSKPIHYVIIGSGKSAMDAVSHIHNHYRDKKKARVTLVAGNNGIAFLNRNKVFPVNPWANAFGGHSAALLAVRCALEWNGYNNQNIFRELIRKNLLLSAVEDPEACSFGFISKDEISQIKETIDETIRGRLKDVRDTTLLMEDGSEIKLDTSAHQIVLVNCTESYGGSDPPKPLLVDQGRTLNVQLVNRLAMSSTWCLTYSFLSGTLKDMQKCLVPTLLPSGNDPKNDILFINGMIASYNRCVVFKHLPAHAMQQDKADIGLWYPNFRRFFIKFIVRLDLPELCKTCEIVEGDKRFPIEA